MRYFIVECVNYKATFLVHAHSENAAKYKTMDKFRDTYGFRLPITDFEATELKEVFKNKDIIHL